MSDEDYDPKHDLVLRDAVEHALARWKGDHELQPGTLMTKYLVIARAEGFSHDGQNVDQIMIVPGGSHEDMLGLMANADTRMRAEIIASILNP